MTLYPRFLLTFSKNKSNNTKFCNEEFLRAKNISLCCRVLLWAKSKVNFQFKLLGLTDPSNSLIFMLALLLLTSVPNFMSMSSFDT